MIFYYISETLIINAYSINDCDLYTDGAMVVDLLQIIKRRIYVVHENNCASKYITGKHCHV